MPAVPPIRRVVKKVTIIVQCQLSKTARLNAYQLAVAAVQHDRERQERERTDLIARAQPGYVDDGGGEQGMFSSFAKSGPQAEG